MAGIFFNPEYIDLDNPLVLPSNACMLDIACGQADYGDEPPAAPAPTPDPDPRTPIQKLLESFDLDEDQDARAQIAHWNEVELPENREQDEALQKDLEGRRAALKDVPRELQGSPDNEIAEAEAKIIAGMVSRIDVEEKKPIAVDTDADVHISESAIPFPKWHLNAEQLAVMSYSPDPNGPQPEEFRSPLMVPEPQRTLEEIEEEGPNTSDPYQRVAECIRLARSMIPDVPVKPKGSKGAAPAGTLGWVPYAARGTEGWMYVEDNKSEYGAWFQELILRKYKDAKALFETLSSDPAATAKARLNARYEMRQAAACIAVSNQEGAPSAINTYDGLVLSWGIGIAGPGKLPETFYHITKDPRVYKALYLCGFRFEGSIMNGEYHGAYQIVDLAGKSPEDKPAEGQSDGKDAKAKPAQYAKGYKPPEREPAVVYRDQWNHKPRAKKYDFEGHAYRVLKYMTLQPKLIHLLIQLAKDPMTRSVVFEPNYKMIQSFVSFVRAEEIHTEALHIFVSQVKHNWGLGPSLVGWAVSRFDDNERARLNAPDAPATSEEKDRAIAKGVVRFLMGRLQEQRWKRGITLMELEDAGKLKDPKQTAKGKFLHQLPATTEFGFERLIENYWKPLHQGPRAQTKVAELGTAGLSVPGFPVEVSGPRKDGHYVWIQEQKPSAGTFGPPSLEYYDLGPLSQLDLLFPHEEITLLGFQDGQVLIEEDGKQRTVRRDLAPTRGGAR